MTGTWDGRRNAYIDNGDFPNRKYMFCYAEYVLKDYGMRYGKYIDSWTFDCGCCIVEIGGDVSNSGRIEEQRIYEAFADAIHAGNPDIPLAFNNGRSNGAAAPYSDAVIFDDFMFGHAFGGNSSHAVKGGTFERNLNFIERMEETNGSVLAGGDYTWDDKIVGNFSSKISDGYCLVRLFDSFNTSISWLQLLHRIVLITRAGTLRIQQFTLVHCRATIPPSLTLPTVQLGYQPLLLEDYRPFH